MLQETKGAEVDTAGNNNIHGEMGGKIFKLLSGTLQLQHLETWQVVAVGI
jgi:hypothetical protein